MELFVIDKIGNLAVAANNVLDSDDKNCAEAVINQDASSERLIAETDQERDVVFENNKDDENQEEDFEDTSDEEGVAESQVPQDLSRKEHDSADEEATVPVGISSQIFPVQKEKRKTPFLRPKTGVFNFRDVYINCDINLFGKPTDTAILKEERMVEVEKLLSSKSIVHIPGFNQLERLPHSDLSLKMAKKLRQEERQKNKGDKWFNMPATEVTEELKRDLEVLQMRSALDPKTFYKKNDLKVLPKYFQIGKVEDNAADFYTSRVPKSERKRTIVEELLADAEFQQRSKQKYKEIVAEKQQFHSRTQMKQAKRQKRVKK